MEKGEPYQLRWLKEKRVSLCCVPCCSSVDIKAEKHKFTWEVICDTIGIADVESPVDISLCHSIINRYIGCLMQRHVHASPVVC